MVSKNGAVLRQREPLLRNSHGDRRASVTTSKPYRRSVAGAAQGTVTLGRVTGALGIVTLGNVTGALGTVTLGRVTGTLGSVTGALGRSPAVGAVDGDVDGLATAEGGADGDELGAAVGVMPADGAEVGAVVTGAFVIGAVVTGALVVAGFVVAMVGAAVGTHAALVQAGTFPPPPQAVRKQTTR